MTANNMDPNFPFGRNLEMGESSRRGPSGRRPQIHRWSSTGFDEAQLQRRVERVLTTDGVLVERPIQLSPPRLPAPPPQTTETDIMTNNPRSRLRPSLIDGGHNDGPPPVQLPSLDAWLAHHKATTRDDLPVIHMRGYRGVMSRNSFRKWRRPSTEPPPAAVGRREDQRRLPRLDYTLGLYDRRGKRTFIEPTLQYDATEDSFFILDWNQSSFEGDAAALLNWPLMFERRNKLEAKCRKYLLQVPKARSAEMIDGRRPNRLHDDVCERLEVEINAMCKRLIRQGLIIKAMRAAERDSSDPYETIKAIRRDPQYATDKELSDYSDDE
ncbi:hypothetical protein RHMOL_Rhmol05G0137700 [Rhododendron molle]|uniref:Uncharacterized protein n=1 Tax=Rhododendron molle TaxID=49168 RepID=A0ACC0NQD3_RHOML|nr:hypothetical protein RHMOL_Rhmol05G0137700 [Rhododendron molle]